MNLLIVKTFIILAIMLVTTAVAAKRNEAFETKLEFWGLFISGLVLLFIIPAFSFPINLGLAIAFAFIMGSIVGPGIKGLMLGYITRQRLKQEGLDKATIKTLPPEELKQKITETKLAIENGETGALTNDWNNVLSLAIYTTTAVTIVTALVVFLFDFDFSFLGQILFVSLLGLIVVMLLNTFVFRSPFMRLASAYVGAVIFTLYLLYDFDRLKSVANDTSWETAINIAISIYLDIVNLFLDLLEIFASD